MNYHDWLCKQDFALNEHTAQYADQGQGQINILTTIWHTFDLDVPVSPISDTSCFLNGNP